MQDFTHSKMNGVAKSKKLACKRHSEGLDLSGPVRRSIKTLNEVTTAWVFGISMSASLLGWCLSFAEIYLI